jgi:hypothetical protein
VAGARRRDGATGMGNRAGARDVAGRLDAIDAIHERLAA